MSNRIGAMVDSFRVGVRDGIVKAREVGASGIQVYAVAGEMDPANLNMAARKELLEFIKSNRLVVSAVCGDLGGHGFAVRDDNEWKIKKSKEILNLANDLEANVVTTHIGVLPEDLNQEKVKVIAEACYELGKYAEARGSYFAIETGPEKAIVLKNFLDTLGTKGIAVNYDPANLVMVTGDDPIEGVHTLGEYIVHTHAKDGKMIKREDPAVVYGWFAEGGIEDLRLSDYFIETPLGEGNVDFPGYLEALGAIGYEGYFTIEREVGENPEADIRKAVQFLKELL
jgi:L-ribulose-5-phosphate 3-epimerase